MLDKDKMIVSRAPGRITFCGGGSDISPIPEKFGGACLNTTISKYATTSLRWRDDDLIIIYNLKSKEKLKVKLNDVNRLNIKEEIPFDIPLAVINLFLPKIKSGFNLWISSDIGLHSGLGTSATVFVSVIGAFNEALELGFTKSEIAETAFYLEDKVLGHPGGKQDQYAAAFGGFNLFEFNGGNNVNVKSLILNKNTINELRENLLLFFLFPRTMAASGEIIRDQIKVFSSVEKFEPVLKAKALAYDTTKILNSGNLSGFADLLHTNWEEKKKFSRLISNQKIDNFYEEIRKQGALAGKILGTGGGGHMLVFCSPLNRIKVIKKAESLGAVNIDFGLAEEGLTTWISDWYKDENEDLGGLSKPPKGLKSSLRSWFD